MSVRKVVKFPERVLLRKTSAVKEVDKDLKTLIKDMFDTMYLNEGVGLSANQVGIAKRIAVINPTGKPQDELVLINPEIVRVEGATKLEEGCLSMPGVSSEVKRALRVEIKFLDLEGKFRQLVMEGLPAIIVQHELDHLNGRLFIDRIPLLKRKRLIKKYNTIKNI